MLIIALSTNIAMMCFVSAVLEIILPIDMPQGIIFGNIVVFVAMVYYAYKAVTVWPDEEITTGW